eukprot:8524599-Pyramimonas_sp.AAC.1
MAPSWPRGSGYGRVCGAGRVRGGPQAGDVERSQQALAWRRPVRGRRCNPHRPRAAALPVQGPDGH